MSTPKKAQAAETATAPETETPAAPEAPATAPVASPENPAAQSLTPEALDIQVERERYKSVVAQKDAVIGQLREEAANLRNQISIATQGTGVPGHLAELVAEKMRVGLSREDAIEVATKQLAHDAKLVQEKAAEEDRKKAQAAKAAAAAGPAKPKQ